MRFVLSNDPIVQECIEFYAKEFDLPNILPERIDGTPMGIKQFFRIAVIIGVALIWHRMTNKRNLLSVGFSKSMLLKLKQIGNY